MLTIKKEGVMPAEHSFGIILLQMSFKPTVISLVVISPICVFTASVLPSPYIIRRILLMACSLRLKNASFHNFYTSENIKEKPFNQGCSACV